MTINESKAAAVKARRYKLGVTVLVAALAVQLGFAALARGVPAGLRDEIGIQGRWAYSRQAGPEAAIDMATTPAVQDGDVWLLLACNESGRLSVALMHADRFAFELDESSSLQLQSARLSSTAVVAERARPAQIVMDPTLVRHIMPMLVEEPELSVSVTARGGAVHRYTFALQPNDVALAPLRSRCSGTKSDSGH
jgi:hypothetical protein